VTPGDEGDAGDADDVDLPQLAAATVNATTRAVVLARICR